MNSKTIFFVGLILASSGVISPPLALLAGVAYGFTFAHPYHADSRNLSRFLLQAAVVALGFGSIGIEAAHNRGLTPRFAGSHHDAGTGWPGSCAVPSPAC